MIPKYTITPDNELVMIQNGYLHIYNIEKNKIMVNVPMPIGHSKLLALTKFTAFKQEGVYFVNLQQNNRYRFRGNRFRNPTSNGLVHRDDVTDTLIPSTQVKGEFIAVESGTSRILWQQKIEGMSVLHLPNCPLPFLVTISRVRDGNIGNQQSMHVDLIDIRSGEIVGYHRNLQNDRIVQVTCRKEIGCIELYGLNTRININFSKKTQRIGNHNHHSIRK